MRIFRHYDEVPAEARGAVVAVGNFDGVHLGHQAVIAEAGRIARALGAPLALVTLEPHPRQVFRPDAPPFRLTPLRIKAHCIEALGVDFLFVLHFDRAFARISAQDFVRRVLIDGLGGRHVVVGYNFVFGHARRGNPDLLAAMAKEAGFGFTCVAPAGGAGGEVYSSTRIREHLIAGAPARAAELLGRSWEIEGRVVAGDARGQGLGFATANICIEEYLRPARGVYAVRAGIDMGRETGWHEGVANFGSRPTFSARAAAGAASQATGRAAAGAPGGDEVFEVHLFDFSADLYGRHLRVALVEHLRPEKKFDGAAALQAQIADDCARARAILAETRAAFRTADSAAAAAGRGAGTA